jgi:hypothetical protein
MFDMMNGGGPGMDYETMARMAQQQQPMVMPPQQQMMPGGGPGADQEAMAQMANQQQRQKQMALIQALRTQGARANPNQGRGGQMVGKFYAPRKTNQVTDLLGAGASIGGSFMGRK